MSADFIGKIEKYTEKNRMLQKGDAVVVGVSGGADSMALLTALHELSSKYDLKLKVAHINHGLRPEAVSEADYVRSVCEKLGIPFFLNNADVKGYAEKTGKGTEEAGRELRYKFFNELAGDSAKIAVAHNMNDLSETMLFHLCRGSGPRGLSSIPPVRGNLIRPLLCVKRSEIEEFLSERGIKYCTDSSNFSGEYTRNRIRNNVLPVLEKEVSGDATVHMAESAALLRKITDFADSCAAEAFERVAVNVGPETVSFSTELMLKEHEYIRSLLVKEAVDRLAPGNRDITSGHIESALELLYMPVGKRVDLPYSIEVRRGYSELSFSVNNGDKEKADPEREVVYPIDREGETVIPGAGRFVCRVVPAASLGDIIRKEYTKCLDCDKINNPLVARTRRTGDRICINSEGGSKKLKDFLIDIKVDRDDRDSMILLAEGSDIVWIPGYRLSEAYKVTDKTVNVLIIDFYKEEIC
ncbi:MAG: tRNA lysidine(34) synthetase TilS [Lachnospiraceae bacterium]|nr:tRNA lysidine(34) synthetase TilS [Lachnospiraceae bacterium]